MTPQASLNSLYDLVNDDPVGAVRSLEPMSVDAVEKGDAPRAAGLLRLLGLAHAYLEHLDLAATALEAALAWARRSGDPMLVGEIEMTRAGVLSWSGRHVAAREAIDRSVATLRGLRRARALAQRGAIEYRHGDLVAALEDLSEARPVLEAHGDRLWLANALTNRGIVWGFLGRLGRADEDIRRALLLFRELGLTHAAVDALQNLGWAAVRLGDLPAAFGYLDEVEEHFAALGTGLGPVWRDRADALLAAHLGEEAASYARRAHTALIEAGMDADAAEALLRVAQAELIAGAPDRAAATAHGAAVLLASQGRSAWAVQARFVELQALFACSQLGADSLPEIEMVATELHGIGYREAALHARLLYGRVALEAGLEGPARMVLSATAEARRAVSLRIRSQAWLAETLLRRAAGDRKGAMRAAAAGIRSVAGTQALLGSTEARVTVAAHGRELGDIGLELAAETGRAATLLRWMELTRAGSLRFPPVRPPDDAELAADLAQLRAAETELRHARLHGTASAALEGRVRRLGAAVRRRRLRLPGARAALGDGVDPAGLRRHLADGSLVEIAVVRGVLEAVILSRARVRRRSLAAVDVVHRALADLSFGLSRLAGRRASASSRRAALDAVRAGLSTLDDLLLRGMGIGGGPVVVIPPAELHAVPWGLLPSLEGLSVSVAPSARLWLDRMEPVRRRRHGVVIAHGPDLPGASHESLQVTALYPRSTRFTARTARVDDVLTAMDGAALVHIVAHGSFRADNPLFSSLRLTDGGLTVYDLERVPRPPPVVVLSACNSGIQGVRPGNETMGIVAGLLGAGVRTVIASTGLVPDTSLTARTMVDLHRRLIAGARPAEALAGAQRAAIARRDTGLAAASFVCFGAG